MSCPTCGRSSPQTQGDPSHGHCPVCGSTLGRTMDNGLPIPAYSLISYSEVIEPANYTVEQWADRRLLADLLGI
jgi:hypothetical protein